MAIVGAPGVARAASFSVDPTLIQLSPRAPSTLLVVRNESTSAVRLQLSAFSWAQSVEGEMQLQPTEDIVFFPALFTLEPGQERKVRVGTTGGVRRGREVVPAVRRGDAARKAGRGRRVGRARADPDGHPGLPAADRQSRRGRRCRGSG